MSESSSRKRSLPSRMISSRGEGNGYGSGEERNQSRTSAIAKSHPSLSSVTADFSKLMEGVMFVLSGFVNPERSDLRSKMLEMGSEYVPDWTANCTLLVCAFSNTPKFRQVEGDGGTIVSKEWILECYNQRKLVDIEPYLLHAGKPWKRPCKSGGSRDVKGSKTHRHLKGNESPTKKIVDPRKDNSVSPAITPSKAKRWAVEDLARTIAWLESQEEKPEPSEIRKIAAEGILTCIQDAVDALIAGQSIQQVTEQWACIPRLVDELSRIGESSSSASASKEALCREAMACKAIYELEFLLLHDDNMRTPQRSQASASIETSHSDSTIEMTEEEIDEAFNSMSSTM